MLVALQEQIETFFASDCYMEGPLADSSEGVIVMVLAHERENHTATIRWRLYRISSRRLGSLAERDLRIVGGLSLLPILS